MSQWIKGDYQPLPGQQGRDMASGSRPRVLYWWPSPVGSDLSAQVGVRMLVGTIVWLVAWTMAVFLLGVLLA